MSKPKTIDPEFAATTPMLISQAEYDRLVPKPTEPGYKDPNPCLNRFGPGPEGKTCKTCIHLTRMRYGHTVLKCDQRSDLTHGPKTDQRAGWNACGQYSEGENRTVFMK